MAEIEQVGGELGQLFISERALEMIVYGALLDIEGLYAPDRVKAGSLLGSISKVYQGGGIQILKVPVEIPVPFNEIGDEEEGEQIVPIEVEKVMKIKLSLVAQFGIPIHQAAEQAIQKVKNKVKELAGLDVEEVEVEITGIVKL
jgi:uncharacterized alkaline shock family protein YloU